MLNLYVSPIQIIRESIFETEKTYGTFRNRECLHLWPKDIYCFNDDCKYCNVPKSDDSFEDIILRDLS